MRPTFTTRHGRRYKYYSCQAARLTSLRASRESFGIVTVCHTWCGGSNTSHFHGEKLSENRIRSDLQNHSFVKLNRSAGAWKENEPLVVYGTGKRQLTLSADFDQSVPSCSGTVLIWFHTSRKRSSILLKTAVTAGSKCLPLSWSISAHVSGCGIAVL